MNQPPPHQPRPKALATLDALIARAEEEAEPLRRAVERLATTGGDSGRAVALLRLAEQRLAQLRESRRVLLEGEAVDERARRHAEANRRWRQRRKASSEGMGEPR